MGENFNNQLLNNQKLKNNTKNAYLESHIIQSQNLLKIINILFILYTTYKYIYILI